MEAKVLIQKKEEGAWLTYPLSQLPDHFVKMSWMSFKGESPSDFNARHCNTLSFDFDGTKRELAEQTLSDVIRMVELLMDTYDLSEDHIHVCASGSKGYHLHVPSHAVTEDTVYSSMNRRVMRSVAESLFEEAGCVGKFDPAPYREGSGSTCFLPNTLRESYNKSKTWIAVSELDSIKSSRDYNNLVRPKGNNQMSVQELREANILPFFLPKLGFSAKLSELYYDYVDITQTKVRAEDEVQLVPAKLLRLLKGKSTTPCIDHVRTIPSAFYSTHRLILNAAILYRVMGLNATNLRQDLLQPIKDNYLSKKVKHRTKNKLAEIRFIFDSVKRGDYPLSCDRVRGNLKGYSRSTCAKCPIGVQEREKQEQSGGFESLIEAKLENSSCKITIYRTGNAIMFKDKDGKGFPFLLDLTFDKKDGEEFFRPVYRSKDDLEELKVAAIMVESRELRNVPIPLDLYVDNNIKNNLLHEASTRGFTLGEHGFTSQTLALQLSTALYLECLRLTKKGEYRMIVEHMGMVYNPKSGELGYVTPAGSCLWLKSKEFNVDNRMVRGTFSLRPEVSAYLKTTGGEFLLPNKPSRVTEDMMKFLRYFVAHNKPEVTIPALAWAMSTFIKPLALTDNHKYRLKQSLFPILLLQAQPESGKSALASLLLHMTGSTAANTFSQRNSSVALMQNRSTYFRGAIFFDEVNDSRDLPNLIELFKGFVSGDPVAKESRGGGSEASYALRMASPIVAGETLISSTSLASRSLLVEIPTKDQRIANSHDMFNWLHDNTHVGWDIASRMIETLALRHDLPQYAKKLVANSDKLIKNHLKDGGYDVNLVGDRDLMICRALLTGLAHLEGALGKWATDLDFHGMVYTIVDYQLKLNKYEGNRGSGVVRRSASSTAIEIIATTEFSRLKSIVLGGRVARNGKESGYRIHYEVRNNRIFFSLQPLFMALKTELMLTKLHELANIRSFERAMYELGDKTSLADEYDMSMDLPTFCEMGGVNIMRLNRYMADYDQIVTMQSPSGLAINKEYQPSTTKDDNTADDPNF